MQVAWLLCGRGRSGRPTWSLRSSSHSVLVLSTPCLSQPSLGIRPQAGLVGGDQGLDRVWGLGLCLCFCVVRLLSRKSPPSPTSLPACHYLVSCSAQSFPGMWSLVEWAWGGCGDIGGGGGSTWPAVAFPEGCSQVEGWADT